MPNVIEPSMEDIKSGDKLYKGKWSEKVFNNSFPIVLELGCGKGEYSVGLARMYPEKNFIGVDIKGARMWVGAGQALKEGMNNVVFLRTKVDFITQLFAENEIDEIWLTFSDPQPNKPNKRLTSPYFIDRYKKILKKDGVVHLKTDSDLLFEYTVGEINNQGYESKYITKDVYSELGAFPLEFQEILKFKTHYETLFTQRGSIIKYAQFSIH